ncbi:MAG TPA: hypothetical protein VFF40_07300 [Acidimicrobiia bacterium]|nr:hypothetical protein [Acidimicrobiia bacterium]
MSPARQTRKTSQRTSPKATPKRGRSARDDWKPGRPRHEVVKAWIAGLAVIVLSAAAVVVLGRDKIWTDDSPTEQIPTSPLVTAPTGDPTTPLPSDTNPPGGITLPGDPSSSSSTLPGAPAP